jgi:hypothetical protein
MRFKLGYLVSGMGVAVAMLSFVATLEADVVHPGVRFDGGPRFDPGAVNRTLKGDRLPLIPGARGANPMQAPHDANQQRICPVKHDLFSPEVAGRCIA